MFTIDGLVWPIPCSITRVSEMTASEISGLLLDRTYFNDVLGTYLRYTIKLAVPMNMISDYTDLYEAINSPVDGHTFTLPYNEGTVEITGRVTSVSDVYVRLANGATYWKGCTFDVIANNPSKYMSLSDVITEGMPNTPIAYGLEDGDTYTYNASSNAFIQVDYQDADNRSY